MINYQTITIDLQPDYREPVVQMYLSESDVGRPIQVNVLMQGQPYNFIAGTTVHIDLRKPSGKTVQVDGNYAVGSNVVLFNVVKQMAAEPGVCLTELSIVGDGQDPIGSKNWLTKVELSPMHAGDPSETWIEDLDELVQDAMEGHIDATLSIPGDAADAAAVGEELADLKSAISDMQTVTGINADLLSTIDAIGAIQFADGVPKTTGSAITDYYKYSDEYIPVKTGDKIEYSLRTPTNYAVIAFYTTTSESSYVQSKSVEGTGGVLTGTYTVLEDGYVRLTTRNETVGKNAVFKRSGEVDAITENVSALQTDVGILQTSLSSAETEITAFSADIDGVAKRTFSLITYATRSGYIKNNGAFAPHANYGSTDYIPINNGDSFVYNIAHGATLPIISFFSSASESSYDVTKSIIGSTDYASGTYTASADGYIVLTYLKVKTDSSVIFYQNIPDNVQVKINAITPDTSHRIKVAIFGDSIFGNDGEIVDYLNQYDDFTDVYNCAFGGTSVSNRTDSTSPYYWFDGVSLWTAITTGTTTNQDANVASLSVASQTHWATIKSLDFSTIDLIVLAYGTNDYTQGKSISDIITAYNSIFDMIRTAYPATRILVLSPIWRLISYDSATSSYVDSDTKTYAAGVTLRQIADGIIADCKTKRVSVFDGYSNVEVCLENVPTFFDNVTQSGDQDQQTGIEVPHGSGQYYSGVHLNATGNLMYAQIIHGLISTLF